MEITNRLKEGEWVLVVSNSPWSSPVYLFSVCIKAYQKLLGLPYYSYNHALRVKDGMTIEMLGNGRNSIPIEEWLTKQDRTVAILKPKVEFIDTPHLPYGYYDIPQIVLNHVRAKLNIGHTWNGKDGVLNEGLFCSEEVALSLGLDNPHNMLPCMLFSVDSLELIDVIATRKGLSAL